MLQTSLLYPRNIRSALVRSGKPFGNDCAAHRQRSIHQAGFCKIHWRGSARTLWPWATPPVVSAVDVNSVFPISSLLRKSFPALCACARCLVRATPLAWFFRRRKKSRSPVSYCFGACSTGRGDTLRRQARPSSVSAPLSRSCIALWQPVQRLTRFHVSQAYSGKSSAG